MLSLTRQRLQVFLLQYSQSPVCRRQYFFLNLYKNTYQMPAAPIRLNLHPTALFQTRISHSHHLISGLPTDIPIKTSCFPLFHLPDLSLIPLIRLSGCAPRFPNVLYRMFL